MLTQTCSFAERILIVDISRHVLRGYVSMKLSCLQYIRNIKESKTEPSNPNISTTLSLRHVEKSMLFHQKEVKRLQHSSERVENRNEVVVSLQDVIKAHKLVSQLLLCWELFEGRQ